MHLAEVARFFVASIIIHIGTGLLLGTKAFEDPATISNSALCIAVSIQILNVFLLVSTNLSIYRGMKTGANQITLRTAWLCFLANIFSYAGFYNFAHMTMANAFRYSFSNSDKVGWLKAVETVYFSAMTQTSVGLGDVVPNLVVIQIVNSTQTLVGILFSALIISQTLDKLVEETTHRSYNAHSVYFFAFAGVRRKLRRYLVFFSSLIQLGNYTLLYYINENVFQSDGAENRAVYASLVFQALQIFLIAVISFKYTRHADEVTIGFLVQLYLSCILTFAGVYLALFLLNPSQRGAFILPCQLVNTTVCDGTTDRPYSNDEYLWVISQLMYFSIAIQSTTGWGDIVPNSYFTRIPVTCHAILAVMFSTVTFGVGLRALGSKGPPSGRRSSLVVLGPPFRSKPVRSGMADPLLYHDAYNGILDPIESTVGPTSS